MRLTIQILLCFFYLGLSSQEKQAEYPGGIPELAQFIKKNVKYSPEIKGDVPLKVYIKFVIDTTGRTCEYEIIKSSGDYGLDNEVMRLVNIMPNWIPATLNGKKVKCYFNLPVNFGVTDKFFKSTIEARSLIIKYSKEGPAYFEAGKYAEAKETFLKVYKLNKKNSNALYELGNSYIKLNNKDSACVCWNILEKEFLSDRASELIKENCK